MIEILPQYGQGGGGGGGHGQGYGHGGGGHQGHGHSGGGGHQIHGQGLGSRSGAGITILCLVSPGHENGMEVSYRLDFFWLFSILFSTLCKINLE